MSRGTVALGVAFLLGLAPWPDAARSEIVPPRTADECEAASTAITEVATRFLFVSWCHGGMADFSRFKRPDWLTSGPAAIEVVEPLESIVYSFQCLAFADRTLTRVPSTRLPRSVVKDILAVRGLEPLVRDKPLRIRCARFPEGLDLSSLKFGHDVSIDGSFFEASLDARRATLGGDFRLTQSVLWNADAPTGCAHRLNLERATIGGRLWFGSSTMNFLVVFDNLTVKNAVFMFDLSFERQRFPSTPPARCKNYDGAIFAMNMDITDEVSMSDIRLRGPAYFNRATIGDFLHVEKVRLAVGGSLHFSHATIKRDFFASEVATCFQLYSKICEGDAPRRPDSDRSTLMLNHAKVSEQVYLQNVKLSRVVLTESTIGHEVRIEASHIWHFRAPGLSAARRFYMDIPNWALARPPKSPDELRRFADSRVWVCHFELTNGDLKLGADFANARLGLLDMSDTKITGALAFLRAGVETQWHACGGAEPAIPAAQLRLKGTRATSLSVWHGSFPPDQYRVDFDGFAVDRVEPVDDGRPPAADETLRGADEFHAMLRLLKRHARTLEPYTLVARILKNAGRQGRADEVMLAGNWHMLQIEPSILGWIQAITTGWGYAPWLIFVWIGGLTLIGAAVLRRQNEFERERVEHNQKSHPVNFFVGRYMYFCFDHILPIIKLRDLHYRNEKLKPASEACLFALRIMGYVLTAGVIASLSAIAPIVK